MSETHGAVAHQFDDLDQQTEASRLGMWAFLVTEIMFFGGLFTGYTMYRYRFPEAFASHRLRLAHHHHRPDHERHREPELDSGSAFLTADLYLCPQRLTVCQKPSAQNKRINSFHVVVF